MSKCIYAYTEPTQVYPGYINLTEQPDGSVLVTVRERGSNGTKSITLTLPRDAAIALGESLSRPLFHSLTTHT